MTRQTVLCFAALIGLIAQIVAGPAWGVSRDHAPQTGMLPDIQVTDYGKVSRHQFPVTGGLPLPQGLLADKHLGRLALFADHSTPIPAQFTITGRWPDGSIKWLLLDFQSTQEAGGTARFTLQHSDVIVTPLPGLARHTPHGIEVNTGALKAVFGKQTVTIRIRRQESWQTVVDGPLVSRIDLRRRGADTVRPYTLPLANVAIETNGPLRTVLKVEGWHRAAFGRRFSPSVVRLTFYRDQTFVRLHHTFVNSQNPDTHLISDIAIDMPLTEAMAEAVYARDQQPQIVSIGDQPVVIFQENIAKPTYPPSREFDGRFRVISGDVPLATGKRYPGSLVVRNSRLAAGVFVKNMWQMSPKTLAYHPARKALRVGIWPGAQVGDLDLIRTEIKRPEHYRAFAKTDPLYRHKKYRPTYVPHDLRHSAMGLSRTHEVVFWFETEARQLDPVDLAKRFTMPFVPFVSGAWNVSTGVMGLQVAPGRYRQEIEAGNRAMMAELRRQIEQSGWYGMLPYGNMRYSYDKKTMNWLHYHPKYAWYNSGHMMGGGTMLQALWYQYLRSGEPLDYLVAEARGLNKMDVSTVHYHQDERLIGNMIRHGGFDPWSGARHSHGGHAPLCGIPIHYYITGSGRAHDVAHLIGQTNFKSRHFEHGRNMDTDINTMALYYEYTRDKKYYDRAVKYVDYYHRTLDQAQTELTFFEYRTSALRHFYAMCEDEAVREKIKAVFLASYEAYRQERRYAGNVEMAAFAYEVAPGREAAQRLEQVMASWARRLSGQLGWLDNMVLQNMNRFATMNAINYGLYWLQEINSDWVEPVRIQPDGGTFAKPIAVTLKSETPEATIRYTLDGREPNETSPIYFNPLLIRQTRRLKARAFLPGRLLRPASTAMFEIRHPTFAREHLGLWLRADAGVSRKGSVVVGWRDQSGYGRHAELSGKRAPEFVAERLNGHPVIRGGHRKAMRLARLLPLSGDATLMFVSAHSGGGDTSVVGDGDDGRIGLGPREFTFRFSAGEEGRHAKLREPYEAGQFALWALTRAANRVSIYRNGQPATKRAFYTVEITPMNLGILMGMRPLSGSFAGELAELLVFNQALSEAERQQIETYLMDKYGLSDKHANVSQ